MSDLMLKLHAKFQSLRDDVKGQGLVEYSLIVVLVSVTAIAALNALAVDVNGVFTNIGNTLNP